MESDCRNLGDVQTFWNVSKVLERFRLCRVRFHHSNVLEPSLEVSFWMFIFLAGFSTVSSVILSSKIFSPQRIAQAALSHTLRSESRAASQSLFSGWIHKVARLGRKAFLSAGDITSRGTPLRGSKRKVVDPNTGVFFVISEA